MLRFIFKYTGDHMCYYLYGSVNDGINMSDYEKAVENSKYHFNIGNKDAVNACVINCGHEYRITSDMCDCENPIGTKKVGKKDLKDFEEVLLNLRSVRGIKYIYLSKNWVEETNEEEETVHINDIEVLPFLANIKENCLYRIDLYRKYF